MINKIDKLSKQTRHPSLVENRSYNLHTECIFCYLPKDKVIVDSNKLAFAIYDGYPVTRNHMLIIPKRHAANFFELHKEEIDAIYELLHRQQKRLLHEDKSISGFNVGINIGEDAGQSIMHVHIHLIPRRKGDMEDPKGGVGALSLKCRNIDLV